MDDIERQETAGSVDQGSGHPRPSDKRLDAFLTHLPITRSLNLLDRAGQRCFLCLNSRKTGSYAVAVPCLRPTKARRIVSRRLMTKVSVSGQRTLVPAPAGENYEELNPREVACESDMSVYERIAQMTFLCHGRWKRWLPFYGVVHVREVNVSTQLST